MLFASLTFSALTQRSTFMVALERDLSEPGTLRRHTNLVVEQLMHLGAAPPRLHDAMGRDRVELQPLAPDVRVPCR